MPVAGLLERALPGGARAVVTERSAGDFRVGPDGPTPELLGRRHPVAPGPWTWLRQVHGRTVVRVPSPGAGAGLAADAAVTACAGAVLAVHAADCAPIALGSPEGVVGAVHAGWRGLVGGVVDAAVTALRALGAGELTAVVGPCIHPECYRFGRHELDLVATRLGERVRSETADGAPALDVPAAVDAALARAGVSAVEHVGGCTACHPQRWFSHRARGDVGRHALVVWRPPA